MQIKSKATLVFTFLTLLILVACTSASQGMGILEGHVTIGPLVPVVREGVPEPTPAPEVFAARQIIVLREGDNKEIARFEIDALGNFRGELPTGVYVVDINHIGVDSAAGFPKVIEILLDQVTRVDVDIDTGIR